MRVRRLPRDSKDVRDQTEEMRWPEMGQWKEGWILVVEAFGRGVGVYWRRHTWFE